MKTTNSDNPFTTPLGNVEQQGRPATTAVETALAIHPFLAGMNDHQLRLLTDCAMLSHFEPGEFILREGDPANRFYLIRKGKVVLKSLTTDQGRVPIQVIGSGDVLGWSWLFEPYFWNFDAEVAEPTDVIFLYATPLREECESDHELGYELLKRISAVVVKRLQATRRQLLDFKVGLE